MPIWLWYLGNSLQWGWKSCSAIWRFSSMRRFMKCAQGIPPHRRLEWVGASGQLILVAWILFHLNFLKLLSYFVQSKFRNFRDNTVKNSSVPEVSVVSKSVVCFVSVELNKLIAKRCVDSEKDSVNVQIAGFDVAFQVRMSTLNTRRVAWTKVGRAAGPGRHKSKEIQNHILSIDFRLQGIYRPTFFSQESRFA